MNIIISENKIESGARSAQDGAALIRKAIAEKGVANIIVATGASQFEMLDALVREDVDWSRVTGFHLDEYIGLPLSHPASFRKYLKERFVDLVPLAAFYYVNGEGNAQAECDRLGEIIAHHPIDVAFIGIGENGHVAFNDPPADFETEAPYIVVDLDDACKAQQMGEGWFSTINDVPTQAISMGVRQILKSQAIVCTVPDERKAMAVKNSVEGDISPAVPASILQRHAATTLYLDPPAASLLKS